MEIVLKNDERIDDLEYKGLKIIQNKNWFCFGIDSVILTGFARDTKKQSKILDLGTGTGIIAILMSRKIENSHITAVEIQKEVSDMAQRSVIMNEIEKDVKFCPKCGAKQEEVKEEPAKEVEIVENTEEQQVKTQQVSEEQTEKTNLEKTVEVESDPNLEDDETVEHISEEE